jgi:hypothetical protein
MADRLTWGALLAVAPLLLGGTTGCGAGGNSTSPSVAARTIDVPPPPVGFTANEFSVAAPIVGVEPIGGTFPQRPICTARQITAEAATRSTSGGVLGVLRLRGAVVEHDHGIAVRCALPITRGPSELIGVSGRRLAVARSGGDTYDPPSNIGVDLRYGKGIWGFAWLGSYCGERARAVEVPLDHADRHWLLVPLRGPQPGCNPTADASVLVDGVPAEPGEPAQPPRPAYSQLRLTGSIEPGTTTTQLAPLDLTLIATGSEPITLDPCPHYAGWLWSHASSGGFGNGIAEGQLPCTDHILVIRPDHPFAWTVSDISVQQSADIRPKPGSTVSVTIGIAGVKQLTLQTTAR